MVVLSALKARATEPTECKEAKQVTTPCKGLLVPAAEAEACIKCTLDLQAEKEFNENLQDLWQADIDEMENLLGIEKRRANELSELLGQQLNAPPFYETVWFGVIVGVVGGVALSLTIVEAAR